VRGWVIRIAIIAVIAIGGFIFRDRLTGNAGDLKVGDCFDIPAEMVDVKDVQHHPCNESHTAEVFAVVTHPAARDADYPGDDAVADFAAAECLQQFPSYTGTSYDDSDLAVASVRPDHDSWAAKNDRAVACVLYRQGASLTGSRRKA